MDIKPTSIICFEESKDAFFEQDIELFRTFTKAKGFIRKVYDGELEAVGLPVLGKRSKKRITHVCLELDDKGQLHREYRTWEYMKGLKKERPEINLNETIAFVSPSSGLALGRSIILKRKVGNRVEKLLCIAFSALTTLLMFEREHLYALWDILTPPY